MVGACCGGDRAIGHKSVYSVSYLKEVATGDKTNPKAKGSRMNYASYFG
jgi:hypothetical protein